jgi:hypothetical protein
MDKGPLVNEEIEGAARFLAEFNKCYPVESAFWLKKEETHNWNLHIVSDQITDENFDLAYDEAARIGIELHDPWFDGMQVKVRGVDAPEAKAVAELRRRYPREKPARFFGQNVDGLEAEEIYVYPSPLPVAVA